MNRCPNCAAQNRDGAKFCTSCGFKLAAAPEPVAAAPQRSPFATTSYTPTPSGIEATVEAEAPTDGDERTSFSTWDTPVADDAAQVSGPGSSWNADPPQDTAVPVSDEMIQTLVGGIPTESWEAERSSEDEDDHVADELQSTDEVPAAAMPSSAPNIDHLLRIARELEYGLTELAEAQQMPSSAGETADLADSAALGSLLAGLQSDEELQPLRNAIETARERPRDVDVMLDLVLRAEAIASVLDERDSLKAAIETTARDATGAADQSTDLNGAADSADEDVDSEDVPDDETVADHDDSVENARE
jgi:hypothetical protein